MRAARAADIANQLGWLGDRVTLSCDGMPLSVWVVIDEDEHHRRGAAGAIASIQELHRLVGADADPGSAPAPPLHIVGVACASARWRDAAAAVGRYITVAPRVVVLADEGAHDEIVRTEARMWGIGLVVDGQVTDWPAEPELEFGVYQRWLAEESYAAWLRGSPTLRSAV